MFNLTYDQIIDRIIEESSLSKSEIESKINEKLRQLSDLVTREGAAHIIANEQNIKLFDSSPKDLKIKDVLPGMRLINLNAKVINVYETREFMRNDRKGYVKSMLIGDETGIIRLVIWDENIIKNTELLKENDIIKIKGSYSKDNNGFKELHLGSNSQLKVNPGDISIGDVLFKRESPKKKISDLSENEYVELMGTIIQVFEPKTFEVCPACGKRVSYSEDKYICDEHGAIEPTSIPLINFFFDDGSGDIRVVAFRDQAEKLLEKNIEDIKEMKFNLEKFEPVKQSILGKQFILRGRVTMSMFNKLEFTANELEEVNQVEMEKVV